MNDFDQAARFAIKLDGPGFFRWLLAGPNSELVFVEWLDTRTLPFPGDRDRTCDTVAHFVHATDPTIHWAIIIESESEPDPEILERLLEYVARIRREVRPGETRSIRYLVAAALLNLTGGVQSDVLQMDLVNPGSAGLRLQIILRTMSEEDSADLLERIRLGSTSRAMLSWIPLMRNADTPAIIDAWKEAAVQESDIRLRSTYAGLALVFADLAKRAAAWKKALEGWNMIRSAVVDEWREQGRKQGLEEGSLHKARSSLIRVLKNRFGKQIPAEIIAAIESCSNLELLDSWLDAASTAPSLDLFRSGTQL